MLINLNVHVVHIELYANKINNGEKDKQNEDRTFKTNVFEHV